MRLREVKSEIKTKLLDENLSSQFFISYFTTNGREATNNSPLSLKVIPKACVALKESIALPSASKTYMRLVSLTKTRPFGSIAIEFGDMELLLKRFRNFPSAENLQ